MTTEAEEPTTRVNMNWPESLKTRVNDAVGRRGLTTFAIAAVEEKLSSIDAQQRLEGDVEGLRKELSETRYLVQLLADRFVMSDDRRASLMEIDLPSWLETNGWPDELAALVPKQIDAAEEAMRGPSGEQEGPSSEDGDEDLYRPMFMTGRDEPDQPQGEPDPAVGLTDGERQVLDLPHDAQGDDLLSRIRAKAAEKGLDIDEARLRPASQIPQPAAKEEIAEGATEPASELEVQADAASPSTPVDRPVDDRLKGRNFDAGF